MKLFSTVAFIGKMKEEFKPKQDLELVGIGGGGVLLGESFGQVGKPSPFRDSKGAVIHVGDIITFKWRDRGYRSVIIQDYDDDKTIFPFGFRLENVSIFEKAEDLVIVQPHFELNTDDVVMDTFRVVVSSKPTGVFSKVGIPALLLSNIDKFKPAELNHELLVTVLGIYQPYQFDSINADIYKQHVQVWEPADGHYVYMYKPLHRSVFEPLAYIRINKSIPHGPDSYLDRIERAYYFHNDQIEHFENIIQACYTKPKIVPYGSEELTEGAIELLTTILLEVEEK